MHNKQNAHTTHQFGNNLVCKKVASPKIASTDAFLEYAQSAFHRNRTPNRIWVTVLFDAMFAGIGSFGFALEVVIILDAFVLYMQPVSLKLYRLIVMNGRSDDWQTDTPKQQTKYVSSWEESREKNCNVRYFLYVLYFKCN